jgi:hypothetical protein
VSTARSPTAPSSRGRRATRRAPAAAPPRGRDDGHWCGRSWGASRRKALGERKKMKGGACLVAELVVGWLFSPGMGRFWGGRSWNV